MENYKFRAWNPESEIMMNTKTLQELVQMKLSEHWANKLEWMQWTGLKDKNGKEIYEGDILTSQYYPYQDDGSYNYHAVCEWCEKYAMFVFTKVLVNKNKRGISDGMAEQIESPEDFEVIGNVFENPEMIESDGK